MDHPEADIIAEEGLFSKERGSLTSTARCSVALLNENFSDNNEELQYHGIQVAEQMSLFDIYCLRGLGSVEVIHSIISGQLVAMSRS